MRRALPRRQAGEKGGAARAAGAAQGPRRAWRALSLAPAGPPGAPLGRSGFWAGPCWPAASESRPSISGCRAPREKPACVGAERRQRRAGFRPLPSPSAPGRRGPAAGCEEPGACGAGATVLLGRRVRASSASFWGGGGRREGKGRAAGAGPRPRPLRGRTEGSAGLGFPRGHAPTLAAEGGGCGRRPPPGSRTLPPGLRSCCSACRPLPRPLHPPSHLPTPREKIMLAGARTSQSLPVRREERAPARCPRRDPRRAAPAAAEPRVPLGSAQA